MSTTVTFNIDTDCLGNFTDEYLAQLWHIGQANPAAFGDPGACDLVEHIGREIIRRWLAGTPPSLWLHQGSDIKVAHHAE